MNHHQHHSYPIKQGLEAGSYFSLSNISIPQDGSLFWNLMDGENQPQKRIKGGDFFGRGDSSSNVFKYKTDDNRPLFSTNLTKRPNTVEYFSPPPRPSQPMLTELVPPSNPLRPTPHPFNPASTNIFSQSLPSSVPPPTNSFTNIFKHNTGGMGTGLGNIFNLVEVG